MHKSAGQKPYGFSRRFGRIGEKVVDIRLRLRKLTSLKTCRRAVGADGQIPGLDMPTVGPD